MGGVLAAFVAGTYWKTLHNVSSDDLERELERELAEEERYDAFLHTLLHRCITLASFFGFKPYKACLAAMCLQAPGTRGCQITADAVAWACHK